MISHDELLRTKRDDILRIAAQYGAYNVRIFGSVARGEADEKSDIDLLVNMESGRSLLDLCELLIDLEELLGRKVDVVAEKGLRDRIRNRVLNEAIAL
jgi:predicted nucleotidyltransferase